MFAELRGPGKTAHQRSNRRIDLPQVERPLIQRKLRAAWANPDADAAQTELEALARALDKKRRSRRVPS